MDKKKKNKSKDNKKENLYAVKQKEKENNIPDKLRIEIKLLSETIFGNGENTSNSVDNEVLQDKLGIPYMKGKTFKGKLREEAEAVANLLEDNNETGYVDAVNSMFGKEGEDKSLETLKFSNCEISENIRNILLEEIENGNITKEEITGAFTNVRNFTKIGHNGIAEEGSLRQTRVVKKNLKYYVDINCKRKLTSIEKGILACSIKALKNIGAMESRGKGQVQCRLLNNNKDVTLDYIKNLEKVVK